jgi:hypothetical protein
VDSGVIVIVIALVLVLVAPLLVQLVIKRRRVPGASVDQHAP